ncbi:MAG: M1 family metallopeptidase [bacterium]
MKYKIEVKLDDKTHKLIANEQIVYINNSGQQLTEIWMHIWPNAYKNDKSAFAQQQLMQNQKRFARSKEEERGYIEGLNFKVNDVLVDVKLNEKFPDVVKLILNTPLNPKDSIVISTPFEVKIPESFSRLGHVDESYQITQWYPKPAVYDASGWHPIPYLDQGEFYSEFASYDVSITLPKNYVVGSTGELQNEEEKLFLKNLSDITLKRDTFYADDNSFPKSSDTLKTLRYIQDNIHDFGWFADKRYHVLQSEVELPSSKKKVTTYVMFTNRHAEYWKNASQYINDAVYYYSLWIGDYPYNYCTAVDGALSAGGGMEYPMVTVIGSVGDAKTLDLLITHEVGHNWFYGILGSNEREYPWLDEGINSFYESRYMRMKYSDGYMISKEKQNGITKAFGLDNFPFGYDDYLLYQYSASKGEGQAINTHSEDFTPINYGTIAYKKTAMVFKYLEQYIGVQKFDSIMQIYYAEWKFKHPQPQDIENVFERELNQDLDWFFKDYLSAKNDPDFKIRKIKKDNDQIRVKVQNTTNIPAPIFIRSLDKKDSTIETLKTPAFNGNVYVYFDQKDVSKIVIDPLYIIPEQNRSNNTIRTSGLFKKVEPVNLRFLGGITKPDKTNLFFSPAVGYNKADGFMPGLALYNNVFPFKNFEWVALGMYGTRSEKFNGNIKIDQYIYPSLFEKINNTFSVNSFSTYLEDNNLFVDYSRFFKASIGTEFYLKNNTKNTKLSRKISYRYIFTKDELNMNDVPDVFTSTQKFGEDFNHYQQFKYTHQNRKRENPFSYSFLYELGISENTNLNPIVPSYSYTYNKLFAQFEQTLFNNAKSKWNINYRVFAGVLFASSDSINQSNFFNLSGSLDYTYDRAFVNRYGNQQQFYNGDASFKSNMFSQTQQSMFGLNLKVPYKAILPIGVFADIAFASVTQDISKADFYYDFGLYMPLIKDLVEVYFPISTSSKINNSLNYTDRIRVMIDFNVLQPLNLIRNIQIM